MSRAAKETRHDGGSRAIVREHGAQGRASRKMHLIVS
jgi:hypothetical protein